MKPEGYIELRFGPRWKYISAARAFIQNFLTISISDQVKVDKIAVAASELLENSVKYASGEETGIGIKVYPSDDEEITVVVENSATPEAIELLKALFEKISQGNPLETYVNQMKEAALRKDGMSQLGLARIRYETGAKMKLLIPEENRVRIELSID